MKSGDDGLFPFKRQTPQVKGRKNEIKLAKEYGARPHPNSGAGRIKDDASTDGEVFEFKQANKTHTVNANELEALRKRASREGKDAYYVVEFGNGVLIEGRVWKR